MFLPPKTLKAGYTLQLTDSRESSPRVKSVLLKPADMADRSQGRLQDTLVHVDAGLQFPHVRGHCGDQDVHGGVVGFQFEAGVGFGDVDLLRHFVFLDAL